MTVDLFGDWATIAGDVATVALVGTAVWAGRKATGEVRKQLETQRQLHRKQRVFELQNALNSREFIEMTATAAEFLDSFKVDEDAGRERWECGGALEKMTVAGVLNFYELIATEYNAGAIDRHAADLYLAYAAISYWRYAEPFVTYLRSRDSAYFAEWKYFYESSGGRIEAVARRHRASYEQPGAAVPSGASATTAAEVRNAKLGLDVIAAPQQGEDIHMSGPSILPLLSAVAITLVLIGLTTTLLLSYAGAALLAATSYRWVKDVRAEMDDLPWDHLPR